ncbi:hypothetical protein GCM10011391_37040 [Pullulanibacillus camelliae]|uniref:Uncharacterized protein n=1 Tax=Pullulanibacillus camelliae TaxID=1707096 RepID=A0A8J2YMK8_9BACL|nr:hypothetical protein [Pullulanibacillus camelliae]GGE54690.1 hypothetical protein GCM10011391_37040 [Pullulanibacillus camelliae]
MLGVLLRDEEVREIEYLLKKELEELSTEMADDEMNHIVRRAMEERYQGLFKIMKRFTPSEQCIKYLRREYDESF